MVNPEWMLDPLEPRRLMSGATVAALRRTLVIDGTAGNDVILTRDVTASQFTLLVNNRQYVVRRKFINALYVQAGGGDDVVKLDRSTPTPATIFGGAGRDQLAGGAANDTIFGGAGNDSLTGNDGLDYLDGGDGDDYFYNDINDVMHGGAGTDLALQGIEFNLVSGIENVHQVSHGGVIFSRGGRTLLNFTVNQVTGGIYHLSAPVLRDDGQYDVLLTFTPYANGISEATYSWTKTVDITVARGHGLRLVYRDPANLGSMTTQYLLPV